MRGLSLESPISEVMQKDFLKATLKSSKKEINKMMKEFAISQIPIMNDNNDLVGLEIADDLLPTSNKYGIPNYALLMAGGRGLD